MKSFYTEHKILVGTILLLFIFSLLCQILIGFLYQNMIKETYNMSSTKNKMLKKCKLKFTNRYELHEKVVNIPVFVDKFIHSIKFGPFSVRGLQHFSGQMLLLSVFVTGAGACRAIITEKTIGEILSYYVYGFLNQKKSRRGWISWRKRLKKKHMKKKGIYVKGNTWRKKQKKGSRKS